MIDSTRRIEALRRQRAQLKEQTRLKQLKSGVLQAWHDRPFKIQHPVNAIPGSKQIKIGPRACAMQATVARKLQQDQQRWAFSSPGKQLQRPWSGSSCHGHTTKNTNSDSTRPATATRPSSSDAFTRRGTTQQCQTSNRVDPSRVGIGIQVGSAEYFDLDGLWRTATGEQTGGKFTDSRYERERAAFSSQQAYTAWFPTDEVIHTQLQQIQSCTRLMKISCTQIL